MNSPSETLRDSIIKIVNENTILGEFKAVPVADQILALFLNKLPEKRTGHLKKCYTDQFKCLCGTDGWNAYEAELRQILEGK